MRPSLLLIIVVAMVGVAIMVAMGLRQPVDPAGTDLDTLLSDSFDGYPVDRPWRDGERHRHWQAVYNGYGTTSVSAWSSHQLTMAPQSAADQRTTHAGLVTTTKTFDDIDVTTQLQTVRQLRTSKANTWEVAWLLWHYTDDHHFYSVVLKPNGWELGKEDPAYPGSQRFLTTGDRPTFPVGTTHTVQVRQVHNAIAVWANGQLLTTYTDVERPYLGGRVGLYTEDAHVAFDSVVVRRP